MATKESGCESDEIINIKCCICEKKNITRDAEKYCLECKNYFCTPCADMHAMFSPSTIVHKLLDKADFGAAGSQSDLPCFPTDRCSVHAGKLLDMYCKNHDEILCVSCVAIKHRNCENIHSIPDEIDDLYKDSVADEIKKQLFDAEKSMKNLKKVKVHLVREVKAKSNKANDSVREHKKEIAAELDRLEAQSLKDIEAETGKIETSLQRQIIEAEKSANDAEEAASNLRKSAGNKAQEFICVKQAQKSLMRTKEVEKQLKGEKTFDVVFQSDLKIKTYFKDLKSIGNVSGISTSYQQRTTPYRIKQQREIDVKLASERQDCWLLGSCLTSDGWLLLSDDANKRLKRVNVSTESVKDHLDLQDGCTGICQTGNDKIAVSTRSQCILFISLGGKMVATRQLKLDHRCFGLAYSNMNLFISDDVNATVYIHDMNGNMLRKISSDTSGNSLFRDTRHITVSGDKVYVADQRKWIVILDIHGNYETTLTDSDLIAPFAICNDGRGNIIVSGFVSSKIVQVSEQSRQKIGVIGPINKSISACFCPLQNKLFVTQYGNNAVKVYALE